MVYIKRIVLYTAINFGGAVLCSFMCTLVAPNNSLKSFLIRLVIVCVTFPTVWLVITYKTDEFRHLLNIAKRLVGKRLKK